MHRLAVVVAFQKRQFPGVLLDLAGDILDDLAAIERTHSSPACGLECLSRGAYSTVNILGRTCRDSGEDFGGGRIFHIDALPIGAFGPFATDQHAIAW